eukprot:330450-Rhodomonas_salina.1
MLDKKKKKRKKEKEKEEKKRGKGRRPVGEHLRARRQRVCAHGLTLPRVSPSSCPPPPRITMMTVEGFPQPDLLRQDWFWRQQDCFCRRWRASVDGGGLSCATPLESSF